MIIDLDGKSSEDPSIGDDSRTESDFALESILLR